MTTLRHIVILIGICLLSVESRKILVIYPTPFHSHDALGRGIVRALINHSNDTEVTYITPFPQKNPRERVTEIDISEVKAYGDINMAEYGKNIPLMLEFTHNLTRLLLSSPAVQEVVVKHKYDAVVSEWFVTDVHAGFAAVLQCPWILVSGTVIVTHIEYLVDTVSSPAVLPVLAEDVHVPMNFWQRMKNSFFVSFIIYLLQYKEYNRMNEEYRHYFAPLAEARGVELPEFFDALHNTSILLINSHPVVSYPQTLPPNAVEVGGYHIDEDTPKLPEDLQKFLDQAKEGFVYFSMGSILKSSRFPLTLRKELLQVLGEIPYTVLWKFEEDIQDKPKNVHVMKWVTQQSVLAHPNIKLFITHGGFLSMLEAVHFGVPLLVVPVFADQPANADVAVSKGFALKVPFSDRMASDMRAPLKNILDNKSYYNRAKELSKLFRGRPVTPSQLINHYVDLAIESKGALHLRSKARLYPFYQRYLLDQLALVVGLIALFCCGVKKLLQICKGIRGNYGKKVKKH